MRILMTTDTVGGVWTFTQELATGLLGIGCAVCLVNIGEPASRGRQEWCDETSHEWGHNFLYETVNAPLEWMQNNEGAYRDGAPRLLQLAKEFGAELLHTNQFCFGALPIDIPRIVTAHSDVFSWADACRNGAIEKSDWLSRYSALVSKGMRDADAIVAPTQWMAASLSGHFPLSRKPDVIPNGRTLMRARDGSRKLQAITAGRLWDEAKNIAMLAEVASPFPLFVAGDTQHGPASMTAPSGNMTLLGPLNAEDLLALFGESAVYICTSKYEPFGLAPLEAALCGCAVLAYDIPSLREVWDSGAVYFDDAPSLTALLHELHDTPHRLKVARQASMSRAGIFTAERMSDAYYHLFRRALVVSEDTLYAS
jgi:glycosyltransferase involved in cell wall biosynthesis